MNDCARIPHAEVAEAVGCALKELNTLQV
jgi:hypothetical protein